MVTKLKQQQARFWTLVGGSMMLILVGHFASCSNNSGGDIPAKNTDQTPAANNGVANGGAIQTSPVPTILPSTSVAPGALPLCSDTILKSPEALACTTMFAYSSKTCVAGLPKAATCSRDDINKVYGTATLNGQPVMAQVDAWIAAGYQPNQCATGSDQKLYVYFLKQTTTPADQSPDKIGHFKIEDKTLGPSGAILTSIKLDSTSPTSTVSCTN